MKKRSYPRLFIAAVLGSGILWWLDIFSTAGFVLTVAMAIVLVLFAKRVVG